MMMNMTIPPNTITPTTTPTITPTELPPSLDSISTHIPPELLYPDLQVRHDVRSVLQRAQCDVMGVVVVFEGQHSSLEHETHELPFNFIPNEHPKHFIRSGLQKSQCEMISPLFPEWQHSVNSHETHVPDFGLYPDSQLSHSFIPDVHE